MTRLSLGALFLALAVSGAQAQTRGIIGGGVTGAVGGSAPINAPVSLGAASELNQSSNVAVLPISGANACPSASTIWVAVAIRGNFSFSTASDSRGNTYTKEFSSDVEDSNSYHINGYHIINNGAGLTNSAIATTTSGGSSAAATSINLASGTSCPAFSGVSNPAIWDSTGSKYVGRYGSCTGSPGVITLVPSETAQNATTSGDTLTLYDQITVTAGTTGTQQKYIAAYCITNASNLSFDTALKSSANATGTAVAVPSSGSDTSSYGHEVVFGASSLATGSAETFTPGGTPSGWTALDKFNQSINFGTEYDPLSVTAQSVVWAPTWGASYAWAAFTMGFGR